MVFYPQFRENRKCYLTEIVDVYVYTFISAFFLAFLAVSVVARRYTCEGGLGLGSRLGLELGLRLGLELTLNLIPNLTLIPTYLNPDSNPNPTTQVYFLGTTSACLNMEMSLR